MRIHVATFDTELLSNLVFELCWSCCDLATTQKTARLPQTFFNSRTECKLDFGANWGVLADKKCYV